MGLYVNPPYDKRQWLIDNSETKPLKQSDFLLDSVADDEFLVVLVDNGLFSAGGVVYSEREYVDFTSPSDSRPKEFFIVKKEKLKPYCQEWELYVDE